MLDYYNLNAERDKHTSLLFKITTGKGFEVQALGPAL
jgi:hypothetical protein